MSNTIPPAQPLDKTPAVLTDVFSERIRQQSLWGTQNHDPFKWLAILGEEVGEVNKAALEEKIDEYRAELIQVAAVAVSMVECLDRQRAEPTNGK